MEKIKVCVLGSTGIVGQVFVWMLANHKWFEPAYITASSSREGKFYIEEVRWALPIYMPESLKGKKIESLDYSKLDKRGIKIIFSALPADIAKTIEPELRDKGFYVFSNASAMRYEKNVPILIPEANLDSIALVEKQGFPERGFVITNANCSTTGLAVALAPLKKFDIKEIYVATYQSVSGAGYPGLPVLDIMGNAIPFIKNEEEKISSELKKILDIESEIYPHCVRIPTLFGHLENAWIKFNEPVNTNDILEAWNTFSLENINIPSMPEHPIVYCDNEDSPQPRMSFYGDPPGMTVYTGRLRKINDKFGFSLLCNNIVKGAAGGSIQNAETFFQTYQDRI